MAVRSAPPEHVSRVRRLPLPVTEPPFDDEVGVVVLGGDDQPVSAEPPAPGTPIQGVLALELEPDAELEELLRPIGLGAPTTADSLWLRDPGPGQVSPALLRARRTGTEAEHASGPGRTSAPGRATWRAGEAGKGRVANGSVRTGVAASTGRPGRNGSTAARGGHARITSEGDGARATGRAGRPGTTSQPGDPRTTSAMGRPGTTGRPGDAGSTGQARGSGPGDVRRPGTTSRPGEVDTVCKIGSTARASDITGQVGDVHSSSQPGPAGTARTSGQVGIHAAAGTGLRRRPGGAGGGAGGSGGADDLPDPRRWVARLAQSAVECLHGRRPVQQLVRWTAEPVYRDLIRRASATEAASAERPRIRSLRVCRVTASVAEASVVVQLGRAARSVAVAVRLEADDGRWLCTAFDLVEPGPAAARRSPETAQRASHASSNATA